jgi:hyperosmotically inducible periplasmic protein
MRQITALVVAAIIAVGSVAATAQAADRSAGRVVDDTKISMTVKSKLVAERPKNLTKVHVSVRNGIVTLSGNVDTDEQRTQAEKLARGVKGVQTVVNDIKVSSPPSASPRR